MHPDQIYRVAPLSKFYKITEIWQEDCRGNKIGMITLIGGENINWEKSETTCIRCSIEVQTETLTGTHTWIVSPCRVGILQTRIK